MIDYSLYVITDEKLNADSLKKTLRHAVGGGATIIQYRNKTAATGKMIKESNDLHKITKKFGIPLIINDRLDVALAVDAEGVHVGQDDMPVHIARKIIGVGKILGASVKTIEQAKKAVNDGADYLGVGDIFGTKSKKDAGEPIGLEILRKISSVSSIPVVGIGGITKTNAGSVISNGAQGIAVISAIFNHPDPEKEAKELISIIINSKKGSEK